MRARFSIGLLLVACSAAPEPAPARELHPIEQAYRNDPNLLYFQGKGRDLLQQLRQTEGETRLRAWALDKTHGFLSWDAACVLSENPHDELRAWAEREFAKLPKSPERFWPEQQLGSIILACRGPTDETAAWILDHYELLSHSLLILLGWCEQRIAAGPVAGGPLLTLLSQLEGDGGNFSVTDTNLGPGYDFRQEVRNAIGKISAP
jgi:hypothetical protein